MLFVLLFIFCFFFLVIVPFGSIKISEKERKKMKKWETKLTDLKAEVTNGNI